MRKKYCNKVFLGRNKVRPVLVISNTFLPYMIFSNNHHYFYSFFYIFNIILYNFCMDLALLRIADLYTVCFGVSNRKNNGLALRRIERFFHAEDNV